MASSSELDIKTSDNLFEEAQARAITRQAGWIVIGLGLVDLVAGLVQAPAGAVNFKIGALLVGLLILFGGMRVHAVVRWLSLLALGSFVLVPVMSFVVVPARLTLTQMRLHPLAFAGNWIPWLVWVAIAGVAALRLGHPLLLAARVRAGKTIHSARIPLVLGLLMSLGGAWIQTRMLEGEAAQKASRVVADKLGPGYQYYTNSLDRTIGKPTRYSATVQAWNEREVLSVPVRWEE